MALYALTLLALTSSALGLLQERHGDSRQNVLGFESAGYFGHNQPFKPRPDYILPDKAPFNIDPRINWHEQHFNGSGGGLYRRSSCPAVNILANRGYINRTGRNLTYIEIAEAFRDVFNFGDDNIMLVLAPTFAVNGWPNTIDLDYFNRDNVQYVVNCPAAPTRQDRELGDNVNLNTTMLDSMLSFSKDSETLSLEDLAEYHHLRHNQSLADNVNFQFGNRMAICALAQYTNMVGVIGRKGKHGQYTLYTEDVRTFYIEENLPSMYKRREAPYYSTESQTLIDRMAHYIGYTVERPPPPADEDTGDIEPVLARFQQRCPVYSRRT